ncbi:MAG: tyrosine--tRNA ligase [Nitrososphaerota archaeon]
MDPASRMQALLRPPTQEVVTEQELRLLLETEERPGHYIGFEISGPLHLGTLFISGIKIRDFQEAGFRCKVFLADWHSVINEKMGGDWELIREAASYYKEAFELFAPGVECILGSDLYESYREYWQELVRLALRTPLRRAMRALTIMGRRAGEGLAVAHYLYPLMQALDIRALGVHVAHAGMDQRKVHMLARDVYPKLGWRAPIALHHELLPGLLPPHREGLDEDERMDMIISSKMSKSKPKSALFVHDSAEEMARKLKEAWCPPQQEELNPVLALAKLIVFRLRPVLEVSRPASKGGDVTYERYEQLREDYMGGRLHPMDLKLALAKALDALVAPYRERLARWAQELARFG